MSEKKTSPKEFMNVSEFARYMGYSAQSISKALQRGVIHGTQEGTNPKSPYKICVKTEEPKLRAYKESCARSKRPKKYGQGGYQIVASMTIPKSELKDEKIGAGKLMDEKVSDISASNLTEEASFAGINMSDCYVYDAEGNIRYNKETLEPLINYDIAQKKMVTLLRKQQLEKDRGELISVEVCRNTLSSLYMPIVTTLQQLPDSIASRISASIEATMHTQMKPESSQMIRLLIQEEVNKVIMDFSKRSGEVFNDK